MVDTDNVRKLIYRQVLNSAYGINCSSPSKKLAEIGRAVGEDFIDGVNKGTESMKTAASSIKFSPEVQQAIDKAMHFASLEPSKLPIMMDKIFEEVRRKEMVKNDILVIIGDKAYKPRGISIEWHDSKSYLNPFNRYQIEVTECPSAERYWTMDSIRRAYSEPKKIIFNGPATIVFWKDGTKTVVKAENEEFDPEKGVAMAYLKKFLGNKGNYFNTIKKAIKMASEKEK